MSSLDDCRRTLQSFGSGDQRRVAWAEVRAALATVKNDAVSAKDEAGAKEIWCLEQVASAMEHYETAFRHMEEERYYAAWHSLEQAELALHFLLPHFRDRLADYGLLRLQRWIEQWQSIYPYAIFMSTELVEHAKKCSICGEPIRISSPCGHRAGEVYAGELCVRVVTEFTCVGMAFTSTPVNKYSVPFIVDAQSGQTLDQYNYAPVRYVVERLDFCTDDWNYEWTTTLHPHQRYSHIAADDSCPCGAGQLYRDCCLLREGVRRPHLLIDFARVSKKLPLEHVTRVEYDS